MAKLPPATQTEVEFLKTEVRTGLTMSKIALSAEYRDKIDRNRANARKAYDTVLRFIPKVPLTADEAEEIRSKMAQLKSELVQLGEQI